VFDGNLWNNSTMPVASILKFCEFYHHQRHQRHRVHWQARFHSGETALIGLTFFVKMNFLPSPASPNHKALTDSNEAGIY